MMRGAQLVEMKACRSRGLLFVHTIVLAVCFRI